MAEFFFKFYFFKNSFRFTAKLSRKYREFLSTPCLWAHTASLISTPAPPARREQGVCYS